MYLFKTAIKTSEGFKILGLGNIRVTVHKIAWQIWAVNCSLMFFKSMDIFTEQWANYTYVIWEYDISFPLYILGFASSLLKIRVFFLKYFALVSQDI